MLIKQSFDALKLIMATYLKEGNSVEQHERTQSMFRTLVNRSVIMIPKCTLTFAKFYYSNVVQVLSIVWT